MPTPSSACCRPRSRSCAWIRTASGSASTPIAPHEPLTGAGSREGIYSALLRARSGTSPEAVAAAVAAAGRAIDARDFSSRGLSLYAVNLQNDVVAKARPP